jgi:poly(A) polymerase
VSLRLEQQPWLTDPATRAVMQALTVAGGPGVARFVGGCVRNALIDRPVDDIDIATRLLPQDVMTALAKAGLRAVPTGLAHGTVTAVSGGKGFEITTLRRDVSTDGRNATVAFTDDWAEDAARRDFRLNALYADADGSVFDPTGQGVADALAGRIVFVGDPHTRIREDYLRILRFFRFMAWYGRGQADAAALNACADLAPGMDRLSAERVSKELLKLLAAPSPVAAVQAMTQAGVLAVILPEGRLDERFAAMGSISDDAVLRLSVLLPADAEAASQAAVRLRMPNAVRERLAAAVRAQPSLDLDERGGRAAVYRQGGPAVADGILRAWAASPEREADARRLLAIARDWTPPRLPVGGRALERLGVPAGPETGRLLKAFEAGWIADDFPAGDHDARLRALLDEPRE